MLAGQLARFLGIGGLATLVHVVTAIAARGILGLPPLGANLTGFLVALLVSYVGHSRVTFGIVSDHAFHFPRFLAVSLASLALSSAITATGTVLSFPFSGTMALVAFCVPPFTYVCLRFWALIDVRDGPGVPLLGALACLAPGALTFLWYRAVPINHDTAWYLVATRKWLGGAELYRDVIEINPPLGFYLTVPSIALADLTGWSDPTAQYTVTCAVLSLSLFWCWTMIARSPGRTPATVACMVLSLWLATLVLTGRSFTQREHLMILLILPWVIGLLLFEHGARGRGGALRGAVAALGICLKPHFILLPLAAALALAWRDRDWRVIFASSHLAMFAVGIVYLAAVLTLHPAYLTEIAPLGLAVYEDYGVGLDSAFLVTGPPGLIAILLFTALAPVAARHLEGGALLLALMMAAMAIYLVQGKGFGYHLLPFLFLGLLLCAWVLWHPAAPRGLRVVAAVGLILLTLAFPARDLQPTPNYLALRDRLSQDAPAESIMTFSPHLVFGALLSLETGMRWTSSYPAMWPLPALLNTKDAEGRCTVGPDRCARLAEVEKATRETIRDDLARERPEILVFDLRPGYVDAEAPPIRAFMMQDPATRATLDTYERVEVFDRFEIWRRR